MNEIKKDDPHIPCLKIYMKMCYFGVSLILIINMLY